MAGRYIPASIFMSKTKNSGKQIEPHKEVSASIQAAIKEVAKKYRLKDMEAAMLYALKDKDVDYEINYSEGLKKSIFEKLDNHSWFDYDDNTKKILSELAVEFITKVDARYATRKNVKNGTDLFPSQANIPEFNPDNIQAVKINKPKIVKPQPAPVKPAEPLTKENVKGEFDRITKLIKGTDEMVFESWGPDAITRKWDNKNLITVSFDVDGFLFAGTVSVTKLHDRGTFTVSLLTGKKKPAKVQKIVEKVKGEDLNGLIDMLVECDSYDKWQEKMNETYNVTTEEKKAA